MSPQSMTQQVARNSHRRADCPDSEDLGDGFATWRVFCDTDMAGLDFPSEHGRYKTDNLTQCVEICSRHGPFCWGAAWDENNSQGALNCWLKSSQGSTNEKDGMQYARLDDWETAENDCSDHGDTYTSEVGDTEYKMLCGKDVNVRDVAHVNAQSMAECMDLCSERDDCEVATYQSDRSHSLFNCFLKEAYDASRERDTSTFQTGVFDSAQRLGLASVSSSSSSSSSATSSPTAPPSSPQTSSSDNNERETSAPSESSGGEGSSAGAIAGGVVGGVVLLLAVLLGVFLMRRRKARSKANAGTPMGELPAGEYPIQQDYKSAAAASYVSPVESYRPTPVQSPPVELAHDETRLVELPGQVYR